MSIFSIDTRSLRLFRVGLGLLVLVDIFKRVQDLTAHYTNQGILPLTIFSKLPSEFVGWSIHSLGGSRTTILFLFGLSFLAAVFLICNYKTKISCIVLTLLTISLHHRNPLILYGVDDLLRVLLFWSCFLPFEKSGKEGSQITSLAVAAILLQVAAMYFFSGIHKLNTLDWRSGNALSIILNIDELSTSLGHWLQTYELLMRLGTYGTLVVECIFPFLLFLPFQFRAIKLFALASLFNLNFGIIFCMNLVLFPYLCLISLSLFIPYEFWEFILRNKKNSVREVTNLRMSLISSWAISLLILFCYGWNIADVMGKIGSLPSSIRQIASISGLGQSWRLFSPPLGDGKWFTIEGTTSSGKKVDVWNNIPFATSFDPPIDFMKHYRNDRWGSYLRGPFDGEWEFLQEPLSSVLCAQWMEKNGEPLQSLSVFLTTHPTLKNGTKTPPITRQLWTSDCLGSKAQAHR